MADASLISIRRVNPMTLRDEALVSGSSCLVCQFCNSQEEINTTVLFLKCVRPGLGMVIPKSYTLDVV